MIYGRDKVLINFLRIWKDMIIKKMEWLVYLGFFVGLFGWLNVLDWKM